MINSNNYVLIKRSMIYLILLSLIVHLIASQCTESDKQFFTTFHPHLDAFWLNTDTELKSINFIPQNFLYNMNQRNSKTILNSMLQALKHNHQRKYFVTEVVFFKDWYDYLDNGKQKQVAQLIHNGQLEITNGAWVENDEAVCYYDDILDQYTIGHQYLYSNFDYQIKIGWATDSFGHSHSQAALEHLLGIQFQGIERVDDRYVNEHFDKVMRKKQDQSYKPLLQFFWMAVSDSNNRTYGGILNHVRHFLHQVNNLRNKPASQIASDYQNIETVMLQYYKKNKLFRFLGNDFQEFIPSQFENLQAALIELNKDSATTSCPSFKYGNPQDYLKAIEKYYISNTLETRKHDFIPNWDQDRYWAGYYTTDPLLKKYCKDFSRFVNLYRKIILTQKASSEVQTLKQAQQLLAVVQHHDGITATSKTYIEDQFCNRIDHSSQAIFKHIKDIYKIQEKQYVCKFHNNRNTCQFQEQWISDGLSTFVLSILTLGNNKIQTISIVGLPSDIYLSVEGTLYQLFCQNSPKQKCRLIFEANLIAGFNRFLLTVRRKDEIDNNLVSMSKQIDPSQFKYEGKDFLVNVTKQNNQIVYSFLHNQYITFGLYTSENKVRTRSTRSWNKYGKKNTRRDTIASGMYIMFNTGVLINLLESYNQMHIGIGKIYSKFIFKSKLITLQLTIKNAYSHIVDVDFTFTPKIAKMYDYFLKVSSNIKNSILYHDSNGYLVSKRVLNSRPDYNFDIIPEDIINSNTYPATAFAYLTDDTKKFIFFSDRAQGVCSYNQSLLINFDRLASDDGKGVSQSYVKLKENIFHYRFGIVSKDNDIQRIWQRQYDEALIGIVQPGVDISINEKNPKNTGNDLNHYLKYTVYHLNKNEIVLRLMNMAEFQSLTIPKYRQDQKKGRFIIDEIGLDIQFVDIRESYANGVPKQINMGSEDSWRKYWGPMENDINVINQGKNDSHSQINLRPLEIRSFRINFSDKIGIKHNKNNKDNNWMESPLQTIAPAKFKLRKSCF